MTDVRRPSVPVDDAIHQHDLNDPDNPITPPLAPPRRKLPRAGAFAISAAGLGGRAVGGLLRDFVWRDFREGVLSLRDLSTGTRSLVWLGFGLLVAVLGVLLANDWIRGQFPLAALPNSVVGRGSLLPIALAPATLFLVSVSWAFTLTGALHAHPLLRIGTVVLYVALAVNWISQAQVGSWTEIALSWGAILLVPVFFAVRWRAAPRPILELTPLLLLASVTFVIFQIQGAESWRVTGIALVLGHLGSEVLSLTLLIMPLLLLVGMGIAGFTRQLAGWTSEAATRLLPGWLMRALLTVFLAWQLRGILLGVLQRVETTSLGAAALSYAGAFAMLLVAGLAWLIVMGTRPRTGERGLLVTADGVAESADRVALPMIATYAAPQLLAFALLTLSLPILVIGVLAGGLQVDTVTDVIHALNSDMLTLSWRLLVATLLVVAAPMLARRGKQELALFLAVFGLTAAGAELSRPDRPLGMFSAFGGAVALIDAWWTLLFAVVGLIWLVRRQLTDERVARLLMLVLMVWLLGQTDFISNRFSPFFGSGGVAFLVFGLAWDALTIGSWANHSTPALPRTSRIFLYLGYSLLTVTVVNWAVMIHDLSTLNRLTGEAALDGLRLFGRPMVYAVFLVVLAAPARSLSGSALTPDPSPA